MWIKLTQNVPGTVFASAQEQQIELQSRSYRWVGKGRPDPAMLPDGYRQSVIDRGRAYRTPDAAERFVRAGIAGLAIWLALSIWKAV